MMKNAMAATSVAKLMQIRKATIRESLSNFQVWNTVLESIENSKCSVYHDSKATNVNATLRLIV
jgi:UDP-N-acetylmuramoylalanine--D-glutamate ligase